MHNKTGKKTLGPWKRAHPTVSFRVTLDDLRRLRALQETSGESLGELLHVALGLVEDGRARADEYIEDSFQDGLANGRREGFEDGLQKGRSEGVRLGRNTLELPCPGCKDSMIFNLSDNDWRFWRLLVRVDLLATYRCHRCR